MSISDAGVIESAGNRGDMSPPQSPRPIPQSVSPIIWGLGKGICRIVCSVGFGLNVYGVKNIPRTGGVLVISNHQSFLDPPLVATQIPRPSSFMAKKELFDVPIFGGLIRRVNAFPVNRGQGDIGAIKEAIKRLKEGKVLVLFPEGTRSRDGGLNPIQPGIAMLIRRSGVPVVPAVIDSSYMAWPAGRTLPTPHPVRVMYGPPLATEGLKSPAIVELVDRTFASMLQTLRAMPPRRCL